MNVLCVEEHLAVIRIFVGVYFYIDLLTRTHKLCPLRILFTVIIFHVENAFVIHVFNYPVDG